MNIVEDTNLYLQQGATWIQPLGYTVDGAPTSFAGCTARMMARLSIDSGTTIISLTTENGGILISGTTLTLFMSDTATAALGTAFDATNKAVYDIEVIAADGTVSRPLHGTLTLIRSITH